MKGRRIVSIAMLLMAAGFVGVEAAPPATGGRRATAEFRRKLEPIAAAYPGAFLAAVYSLFETRQVFFEVVGEDPEEPWRYRTIAAFDKNTSAAAKQAVVQRLAELLDGWTPDDADHLVGMIRAWCETDAILELTRPSFGAYFSADATHHLMKQVRPNKPYESTPEGAAAKLDPPELTALFKDVLEVACRLGAADRNRFLAQVFAYAAEHPRGWGVE